MNIRTLELFGFTEDEQQLRDSVNEFLRKQQDPLGDAGVWRWLAELGWTGACVSNAAGGYAETGREALIIAERLGAHGVTAPLVSMVYAPARLLCADVEVMGRHAGLLKEMADGSEKIVIAWSEPGRPFVRSPQTVDAKQINGGWRISGRKLTVWSGDAPGHAIVSARAGAEAALFLVPIEHDDVEVQSYETLAGFKGADLTFRGANFSGEALIASGRKADILLDAGLDSAANANCCDLVGTVERALSITEEYARTRKQFGQSIASFQVIQHRLVDMAIDLEYARSCEMILLGSTFCQPGASHSPSALAGVCSEIMRRAQHAVADAVQLHGGIGMTEEAPIGHYFKRVAALANTWGNADWQLARYRANRSDVVDLLGL